MHVFHLFALCLVSYMSVDQLRAASKKQDKIAHRHHSSSSSSEKDAFDGAYSQYADLLAQPVPPNTPTAVAFVFNQPGTPLRVLHPLSSDNTKFEIKETGSYLIGWTVNLVLETQLATQSTDVTIQLFNFTTSSPISPDPFNVLQLFNSGESGPLDAIECVSGQTIVSLPKGTILQLRVTSSNPGLFIYNPTFFIARNAKR